MSTLDTRLGTVRDWITQMRLGNPIAAPAVNPADRQTIDIGPGETLEIVHAADPGYQRLVSLVEQVFEPGANLIPVMSGPVSDLCAIAASSNYSETTAPWRAVDGLSNTHWSINAGQLTGWWRCCFTEPQTAAGYAITAMSPYGDSCPRDWTLRGSNDGVNWTVLDERAGVVWSNGQRRAFSLAQPATFACWEIQITGAARPDYTTALAMSEVQIYAPASERILVSSPQDYRIEYLTDRTRIQRLAAERRRLTATVRL